MPANPPTSFGLGFVQNLATQGATGLSNGLLGQLFAASNARRQWKYTQKQMALQQQYALEQMQKQSEMQYSNWQKQFDYENAFNDPSKIRDRWEKAGASLATVLGSSGVGVNATISGGSPGSVSASGPSASFSSNPGNISGPFDPRAAAQNMLTRSEAERNDAAAEQSRAEANRINNQNLGKDFYARAGELSLQLSKAHIIEAESVSRNFNAAATWQEAQNGYADLIATAEWQKIIGEVGLITEEYNRLRAQNDAEIPFMAQLAAANVSYLLASSSNLRASAEVSSYTARDLQEWFRLNWESSIDIPDVDENGKPNGKTVRMTGRQIQEYLFSLSVPTGKQSLQSNWFETRSRKNALGYNILNTIVKASAEGVAGYVTKGKSMHRSQSETYMDESGTVRGYVLREMSEKTSAPRW